MGFWALALRVWPLAFRLWPFARFVVAARRAFACLKVVLKWKPERLKFREESVDAGMAPLVRVKDELYRTGQLAFNRFLNFFRLYAPEDLR